MTDSTKPHGVAYIPRSQVPTGVERDGTFESFYGGKDHPGNFARLSMKYKVSELEGALLDAAVALAHGWRYVIHPARPEADGVIACPASCSATVPDLEHGDGNGLVGFAPSESWEDGGPIIERERIAIWRYGEHGELNCWNAMVGAVHGWDDGGIVPSEEPYGRVETTGPTPLIAAMRAFVASRFGDEVEL